MTREITVEISDRRARILEAASDVVDVSVEELATDAIKGATDRFERLLDPIDELPEGPS